MQACDEGQVLLPAVDEHWGRVLFVIDADSSGALPHDPARAAWRHRMSSTLMLWLSLCPMHYRPVDVHTLPPLPPQVDVLQKKLAEPFDAYAE